MINHFRTLLLNLSDTGTSAEHITKGFTARELKGELLSIYNILFPGNREDKLKKAHAYLELIHGTNLSGIFTKIDNRITYDLNTDFPDFKTKAINIEELVTKLEINNGNIVSMFALPKVVDTDVYDNLWLHHPNPLYRLAGLIVAYVIRLS